MTDAYGTLDLTIFWMFISFIAPTAYKPLLSMSEASRHFSRLATMKLSEWIFLFVILVSERTYWMLVRNWFVKRWTKTPKVVLFSDCITYCFVMNFRRYLRETLKMANAEDLNRLTSCSLVLLGHIFLSLGNNAVSDTKICTYFLLLILKWETIIVFMLYENHCQFYCLLKMPGSTQYGHTRHAVSWKNLRCPCTVVGVITPQR